MEGLADFVRRTRDTGSTSGPNIWLTEMGGVLTFHFNRDRHDNGSLLTHEEAAAKANADFQYLLGTCLTYSHRITRAYIYSWAGLINIRPDPTNGNTLTDFGFDSGLTDQASPIANGSATNRYQTRSMYCTLKKAIVSSATCTPQVP